MDPEDVNINGDTPETPLIAKRAVTKSGTPKNVGYVPSIVYFVLLTFGYPLINMSLVYYQAGVIPTVLLFIFFSVLSAFLNLLFSDGIALLEGNEKYELNLEFSGLAKELFSRKGYYVFLAVYLTYQVAANIAMCRIVAQAADDFVVLCSGHAYGLQFYPHVEWVKAGSSAYFYANPDHTVLAITAGYLITVAILAPMAFFQLFAALWIQAILLFFVALACVEFVAFFVKQGLEAQVPLFGSNWTQVMGPIIFNLGVGAAMPLWLNQKRPDINTKGVVLGVSFSSMILNIALPVLGVYVYGSEITADIFELMTTIKPTTLCRIAVYVYTLTVVGASIPINSITVKNNLYTEIWANVPFTWMLGIFFQFMVGWLTLSGGIFMTFLNYVSLFLGGFSGFFFPLIMYYLLQKQYVQRTGHPGSPLGLIPKRLLPYWKWILGAAVLFTAVPTVAQILLDFYFLIFKHKNVV